MENSRKKEKIIHGVMVRFGPLFADEKRNFCCNGETFYDVPQGAHKAWRLRRAHFSQGSTCEREGRFSTLHKGSPGSTGKRGRGEGGLCQGTPSEGFARRKVI